MGGRLKLPMRGAAWLLLAVLFSCADKASEFGTLQQHPSWPSLPSGSLDAHQPSATQSGSVNGNATYKQSAGATANGTALELDASGAGDFEWAFWKYVPPAGSTLQAAHFDLSVTAGASVWIGVANYTANRWTISGPFSTGPASIDTLSANNVSPNGNVYLLVGVFGGTSITVHSVSVDYDPGSGFFITGKLYDINAAYGFGNRVVTLNPGGLQATTDTGAGKSDAGDFTFMGLPPGDYTLTTPDIDGYNPIPLKQVTINTQSISDADLAATPTTTEITYTNHIKVILDSQCVECHGETNPGGGKRFDTYLRPDSNDVFHNIDDGLADIMNNQEPRWPKMAMGLTAKQMIQDWINVWNKKE